MISDSQTRTSPADSPPMARCLLHWTLIVPVSDEHVFNTTLHRSPIIDSNCELLPQRGFACAGKAYNTGIDASNSEILVFAHQDVYLPPAWVEELSAALRQLDIIDPNWGVLGLWGIRSSGQAGGFVHSTGLGLTLGQVFGCPIEAQSLDELLFDHAALVRVAFRWKALPGFHLYTRRTSASRRDPWA